MPKLEYDDWLHLPMNHYMYWKHFDAFVEGYAKARKKPFADASKEAASIWWKANDTRRGL